MALNSPNAVGVRPADSDNVIFVRSSGQQVQSGDIVVISREGVEALALVIIEPDQLVSGDVNTVGDLLRIADASDRLELRRGESAAISSSLGSAGRFFEPAFAESKIDEAGRMLESKVPPLGSEIETESGKATLIKLDSRTGVAILKYADGSTEEQMIEYLVKWPWTGNPLSG